MMPQGAKVISAHAQNNGVKIWALVDKTAEPETRNFMTLITGDNPTIDTSKFIGTVLLDDGAYVVHIFELV